MIRIALAVVLAASLVGCGGVLLRARMAAGFPLARAYTGHTNEEEIMHRLLSAALLAALLCSVLSSVAHAQTMPDVCDTPRERARFRLGVRQGRNLGDQAIARLVTDDECPTAEQIEQLQITSTDIVVGIVIPPDVSDDARCLALGKVAGLLAEISDLQERCSDTCVTDGTFIGEISALLYCELSIALDGLGLADLFERLATDACGERFQDACDAAFELTATSDPDCEPFTVDPFDDVFAVALNNQCADNPADP